MKLITLFDIKVDFSRSHNSYVYDKNTGKEYLDFFSMYSSLPLGYSHEIFDDEFFDEIRSVAHLKMTNNVFQTDEMQSFIDKFSEYSLFEDLHFCSTGALAVESGIKCAMEYKKVDKPIVLGLKKSFHGVNAWGFITDRFAATAERMKFFPKNDWKNLEIDELIEYLEKEDISRLVAVIVEPIQCTAGDIYVDVSKLKRLNQLCNEKDVCFIVDEIQTGLAQAEQCGIQKKSG